MQKDADPQRRDDQPDTEQDTGIGRCQRSGEPGEAHSHHQRAEPVRPAPMPCHQAASDKGPADQQHERGRLRMTHHAQLRMLAGRCQHHGQRPRQEPGYRHRWNH